MPKIQIPLDLLGQEIIPGDLVVFIESKGRGVNSSLQVVHRIKAKSVAFREGDYGYERSIKCIKVTEEQAMNHRIENYNSPENRTNVVNRKIQESRELKEKFGRG